MTKRKSSSHWSVLPPTESDHPATKYYVDEKIIEVEAGAGLHESDIVDLITATDSSLRGALDNLYSEAAPEAAAWGSITGALSNQTDLSNALNSKQSKLITGTTTTAASTATKVVTASQNPVAGDILLVTFSGVTQTAASVSLNVNSTGAKSVYAAGLTVRAADLVVTANGVVPFFFDGTFYHLLGATRNDDTNTTYTEISVAEADNVSSTTAGLITGRRIAYLLSKAATVEQGLKADTAVQPGSLATVATSGSYNDLSNRPTLPTQLVELDTTVTGSQLNSLKSKVDGIEPGAEVNVNADWNSSSGDAQILNKPTIPTTLTQLDTTVTGSQLNSLKSKVDGVAAGAEVNVNADWNAASGDAQILNKPSLFSGSYTDLSNRPATFPPGTHSHVTADITGLQTTLDGKQASLGFTPENTAAKAQPNGYASLDSGGKVPAGQLPNSVMEYQGTWDASINIPPLADGTGNPGDVRRVTVGGTQNLGSGSVTYAVGDYVIYSGTAWERSGTTDSVPSVAGLTGDISASALRTALSLVVGTDVQAYDSDLTTWAEKTPPSGPVVGTTDSQTLTGKTISGASNTLTNISADALVNGTTNHAFTAVMSTKLAGIADGATANDTDANLKDRANHTGTQSADTLTDGTTNRLYSTAEKTKLSGIATGAEVNVNADWNSSSGDSQILNKPSAFPPSTHTHVTSEVSGLDTALAGKQGKFITGSTTTAAGTAAKVVTASATPAAGDVLLLTFSGIAQSAAFVTLNVNGGGAKAVYAAGAAARAADFTVSDGGVVPLLYDGTYYHLLGATRNDNTTYSVPSEAEIDAGTETTSRVITAQRIAYILGKALTSATALLAGRSVSAGTGLTGGGDLSANRTLAADFGTGAGKVCQGNDPRLSDARTPTAHTHTKANITDFAHTHAASDTTSGTFDIARIPTGTSGSTVCVGNDPRLSDARIPTAHTHGMADLPIHVGGTPPVDTTWLWVDTS